MQEIIIKGDEAQRGSDSEVLNLSIPRRNFGEFVKGLLGRPYEISRILDEEFDVDQEWINQTSETIIQKVQQHDAELVEFSGGISFSDGLEKRFSDLSQFNSYVNTQELLSRGAWLSFIYLIQFPNRSIPERQQITINISTSGTQISDYIRSLHEKKSDNCISYSIQSTERTWAEDIEKIIRERVFGAIVGEIFHRTLVRKMRKTFGYISIISSFAVPILLEYLRLSQAKPLLIPSDQFKNFSELQANEAIYNIVSLYISSSLNILHVFFYIGYAIFALIFSIYLSDYDVLRRSFVVYGEKSRLERNEFRERQRRNPFSIVRDFVIGLLSSALISYIFLKYAAYLL